MLGFSIVALLCKERQMYAKLRKLLGDAALVIDDANDERDQHSIDHCLINLTDQVLAIPLDDMPDDVVNFFKRFKNYKTGQGQAHSQEAELADDEDDEGEFGATQDVIQEDHLARHIENHRNSIQEMTEHFFWMAVNIPALLPRIVGNEMMHSIGYQIYIEHNCIVHQLFGEEDDNEGNFEEID